jgi:phage shock protein A
MRSKLARYSESCEKLASAYERNAVEAIQIGNRPLARKFTARMITLESQVKRAKVLQLMLSDIELSREQSSLFTNLGTTMKEFVGSLSQEDISVNSVAEVERDLSSVLMKSEKTNVMLGDVIDLMSEKMSRVGEVDEGALVRTLDALEVKTAAAEKDALRSEAEEPHREEVDELDKRIAEGLRKTNERGS